MAIYRATTETGSIYIVDTEKQTWRKERKPSVEGPVPLRSQSGSYNKLHAPIEVGKPIVMTGQPLDKRATFRLIETSYVVKLEELEADEHRPHTVAPPRDFRHVKTGDVVIRMLAGTHPVELKVTDITDDLIVCGDWTFERRTGAEVDEALGWGIRDENDHLSATGSFLVGIKDEA